VEPVPVAASLPESPAPVEQPAPAEPIPAAQPVPVATQQSPPALATGQSQTPPLAPPPAPIKAKDPSAKEERRSGIGGIVDKAKGLPARAIDWIGTHKVQAGLIGAGVAIASIVAGWAIFRAIKARKAKNRGNHRRRARSFDVNDDIYSEVVADIDHHLAQQDPLDGIDLNDPEFLEFLETFDRGDFNLD